MSVATLKNISSSFSNLSPENSQELGTEKKIISEKRIFVVQRHLASVLHYDLRIQIDGVLKSWALPSGPSMNPDDRRFAVAIDDKPMEFASLKGKLKEKPGAEVVEPWDKGIFIPHTFYSSGFSDKELLSRINEGRLSFTLRGKKLKGVFSLIRLSDPKHWLLIKGNDKYAVDYQYKAEDFVDGNSVINKLINR